MIQGATIRAQAEIGLKARERGLHLVTREIEEQLPPLPESGLLHLFILHTSAALTINENADPDVLHDMAMDLDRIVPENAPYYRHTLEGADDMPAHTKSSLLGPGLLIPVRDGKLWLGTWQGIYLAEFRDRGGSRRIAVTVL